MAECDKLQHVGHWFAYFGDAAGDETTDAFGLAAGFASVADGAGAAVGFAIFVVCE